eukprot:GHVO01027458.1.p1 GENE.GHVO01027458.1~~GHVO01027458.1.p1  ORF type:complete len:383 (-),score=49.38 GHVO01027458.1:115-1236(-)
MDIFRNRFGFASRGALLEANGYPTNGENETDQLPVLKAKANSRVDNENDVEKKPLFQCPHCSRTFQEEPLQKHMKICKKVFQDTRKTFNSSERRLRDLVKDPQTRKMTTKARTQKNKLRDWRFESAQFRAMLKGPDSDVNTGSMEVGSPSVPMLDPSLVKCKYCPRRFRDSALVHHEKVCTKIFGQKKSAENKKPVYDPTLTMGKKTRPSPPAPNEARKRLDYSRLAAPKRRHDVPDTSAGGGMGKPVPAPHAPQRSRIPVATNRGYPKPDDRPVPNARPNTSKRIDTVSNRGCGGGASNMGYPRQTYASGTQPRLDRSNIGGALGTGCRGLDSSLRQQRSEAPLSSPPPTGHSPPTDAPYGRQYPAVRRHPR